MKNLKISLSVLPLLIIACLVYFTATGSSNLVSNEKPLPVEKSHGPSNICQFQVSITSSKSACLTGSYTYCINGGPTMTSGGIILVEVPCGRAYTLCVKSSSGCKGSIVLGTSECPCTNDIPVDVYIEGNNPDCSCTP